MNSPFRVGKSRIHGLGVFATRFIQKGETLVCAVLGDPYAIDVGGGFNHSCNHNLTSPHIDNGRGEFVRQVVRDIEKGEEMTVSYATLKKGVVCLCPICRRKNQ